MREKNLEYTLDWIAIQELVAEYGQAIDHGKDTGDWTRWERVFTPEVTSDYSRFMGVPPVTQPRAVLAKFGDVSLECFTRTQHATANTVRTEFKSDTQATVHAYAEVSHFFKLDGVPQEWTLVGRYTHEVVKTAQEGWRIQKVTLDPMHQRGNLLGLQFVQGKRLGTP
ncbi:nuclear transport factor 2 family protein [Corallococcus terminator]|uniref:Nuclear transport factor 2 family protein n=1 Tax=Corallococcus terminator TaxID=2316733 RepID=A0A3A8JAE4_9BACT|nr:nuclear transport factor 2 family protein [Corallococcus terminator]RKG92797.1 nuclear transport factor 2 family protein [Corallococcus terminator]